MMKNEEDFTKTSSRGEEMAENRNYYKKKIVLLLFILTIVFGLFSLYQYYRVKITSFCSTVRNHQALSLCGSSFCGGQCRRYV